MTDTLRIATRQSPLALWQAEWVRHLLIEREPDRPVELVRITTEGDRRLEVALAKIGGKGLFIKELEQALYDNRADMAVHSMKDVTAVLPEGLEISCVLSREDPDDALVAPRHPSLDSLPPDAIIGTSSPRRKAQLLASFPGFRIRDCRGNVQTRLGRLDSGEYDAIILACAGLKRLEMQERIRAPLDHSTSLPAVGQGIVGIETRSADKALKQELASFHDGASALRLTAERAFSRTLNGGCSAPIAAHAIITENTLTMAGRVIALDGKELLADQRSVNLIGDATNPQTDTGKTALANADQLGTDMANHLLEGGAQRILEEAEAIVHG